MTTDIDATVRGDAITPSALVKTLAAHGIVPRIEDAVVFARENLVLLLRHRASGVDLDLSFAWSDFEHQAIEASTRATFGRARASRLRERVDALAALADAPELVMAFDEVAARTAAPRSTRPARTPHRAPPGTPRKKKSR